MDSKTNALTGLAQIVMKKHYKSAALIDKKTGLTPPDFT